MAASDPRIEEILRALEIIKSKLPNGELESIKKSIESLSTDQNTIKDELIYFRKRLFNPDDGVIVRINKNADTIARFEEQLEDLPDVKHRVDNVETWQEGVNRALWFIFTSVAGLTLAAIYALLLKKP